MKIIKKAVVFVTALSVLLTVCLSVSADSVTDGYSTLYSALNRYSSLSLFTNHGSNDITYVVSSDARVGRFSTNYTQNQYLDIVASTSNGLEYKSIETWLTTYPDSENYDGAIIRQGFLSAWLKLHTSEITNSITIRYDDMYYDTKLSHADGFAIRSVDTASANVVVRGNIVTHNYTTGDNVLTSFQRHFTLDDISTASSGIIWDSAYIIQYFPTLSGKYKLTDVEVTISTTEKLNNFSVFSMLMSDSALDSFYESTNNIYDSGSDLDKFDFSFLLDAVEAFLSFELLPGLKLYMVFVGIAGWSMFYLFLKMFAGG